MWGPSNGRKYDYRGRVDWDDSKFTRVYERPGWDRRVNYHPPRYYGGFYFYDYGWPGQYYFPCRYSYWVFSYVPNYCVPSVYYYYDYFPYIPSVRIVVASRPVVTYVEVPIVIHERDYSGSTGYYLEAPIFDGVGSIDKALSDIRTAWTQSEPDLLLSHVSDSSRIDVLLDGKYSYTLEGSDYRDMTRDAITGTETVGFVFDSVKKRGDDRVIAYARHTIDKIDGDRKIVYVSYELVRKSGEWIISQVGSSSKRID